ncbi:MAG: hypothetical protein K2M79_07180 [Muribaculaceae bacterium]|nr:hypothetical protein [Muribaculaceae bacterium]
MAAAEMKVKRPRWLVAVIITASLPVFMFPWLLSAGSVAGLEKALLWLYPPYVVAAAVCAYICWPARKELCVILILLLLMTHAAMWLMCCPELFM